MHHILLEVGASAVLTLDNTVNTLVTYRSINEENTRLVMPDVLLPLC